MQSLATQPSTAVEPTWWISVAASVSTERSASVTAWKRTGQAGSGSCSWTGAPRCSGSRRSAMVPSVPPLCALGPLATSAVTAVRAPVRAGCAGALAMTFVSRWVFCCSARFAAGRLGHEWAGGAACASVPRSDGRVQAGESGDGRWMEDASGGSLHLGEGLELLELLGRGGSGAVYRARDTVLGRTVAVKVLRGVFGADPAELLTEARVQSSVGSHSNVLTVLGHGFTEDGWQYLVLEDAAGGSLRERVTSDGPLSVGETLRFCDELVDALSFAHAAGVVHCDVKPSNVLFSEDGSVRLADFGTALSSTTQTLEFLEGSLVFAPPELLEGRRPTGANDIYGMAVTAWFALAGAVPFGGLDQPAAAVIARIHSEELTFDGLSLPTALRVLFERCVAKDPAARPHISVLSAALRRAGGIGDEAARLGCSRLSDRGTAAGVDDVDRRAPCSDRASLHRLPVGSLGGGEGEVADPGPRDRLRHCDEAAHRHRVEGLSSSRRPDCNHRPTSQAGHRRRDAHAGGPPVAHLRWW